MTKGQPNAVFVSKLLPQFDVPRHARNRDRKRNNGVINLFAE